MKGRVGSPPGRWQRGATVVEFALIAPLFFAMVIGLISAATYVFEAQVANDSAQAAARWAIAAANFTGTTPAPQCPSSVAPAGMVSVAKSAAGPLAGSITSATITDLGATAPAGSGLAAGTYGCEIQVTVPYVSFGGFFDLGPTHITATAVDYVT